VRRGGEKLLLEGVRFPSEEVSGMTVSRADFYLLREDKNPVTVLKHGVLKAGSFCGLVWDSIVKLVTGDVGLDQLSGPVGTTAAIGEAASQGFETLMMFTMFISINLGIFNLLPLPALDGGRLLLLAVEKLRGKKLSPKVEGAISFVGFSLLMLLMLYVTAGDIFRLMG
jgi:regulator of sigma E protease